MTIIRAEVFKGTVPL